MISIICVSNNNQVLNEMLIKSCEIQSESYELIVLENTKGEYKSAASALNAGALKAKGDILVFAHQDISFDDKDFFKKIKKYLNELPTNSNVGLAGIKDKSGVITNLKQGLEYKLAGSIQINEVTEVQTLDEVLIASHSNTFNQIKFDEKVCDDWHLYGVDYSLTSLSKGFKNYVLPLEIFHKSSGKISLGYALTLNKVISKHRLEVPFIYTTCGVSKTSFLRSKQYILGLIWDHVIKG